MPAPEPGPAMEEGLSVRQGASGHGLEPDSNATNILASVKEQELQFERLTRELEVERQIVASQLERCRLGAESPGAASGSSSEKSYNWRSADASTGGETKSRVTDSSQSPPYHVSSDPEPAALYSPEQTSLHESEGSAGNSRSSTQMNSYSDSGYQDAGSYYSGQNLAKAELRLLHSYPGTGGGPAPGRNARAEGQASVQASASGPAASGRALRRAGSAQSRTQSPAYGSSASPSRGSLRTSLGSAYGSPVVTEPKPLPAVFPSATLPPSPRGGSPYSAHQGGSPAGLCRAGSSSSRSGGGGGHASSPYQGRAGSPLTPSDGPLGPSPTRGGMTAVPQHYGSTLPCPLRHEADPYGPLAYDVYERMIPPRPDSLADALIDDDMQGLRSSYASQHSQLRSAMSPDRHITPIYEDGTFHGALYHSPNHGAVELNHSNQSALYRSASGVGNLQLCLTEQFLSVSVCFCAVIGNLQLCLTEQFLSVSVCFCAVIGNLQLCLTEQFLSVFTAGQQGTPGTARGPATAPPPDSSRSPRCGAVLPCASLCFSVLLSCREFAWRDPELPEVIHMLQHQFPSVQANAAAYLQHLCFGDNRVKAEVCHLGGIKHLVDLLDHKVVEVQRNACGALRNLVYGKATDDNKVAVRNAGGVPALLRLLRKTADAEVRELVTGVLWNLSSCDAVKMTIVRDALNTLTNTVIIPHSGWSSSSFDDDHKLKFHSSLVLRNTSGCLRCSGVTPAPAVRACVSTSDFDSKIVENCICTLRNLSYRLELEMPQARLLGTQGLDGLLLGSESPSKEADSSCWGKKKKKKKTAQDEQWDGVGPIPGFSKSPKGAEMLWHPAVVKPYLTLLAESSNPATLEGSAGSLQNLSAGNWKFAAYIRAAVRKEKGLPILVELLRMDNDRVVCSVATALRNMALDVRNKELIGKYAMRDLVNRLPGGSTTLLSDETVAAVCCTLHEVTSKNMENAKALADTGGIEKLVNITKGRGERYSMKVVKAAAQVLNTLWQYRDLRTIYKKDGWNQNHFITPVTTLERDRYKSQPTLPSSTLQMSPVIQSAGSATSSPAMLGIKEHRSDYQRTKSSMQFYNYQGDNSIHKSQYTGSGKPSPFYIGSYSSPSRERDSRRAQHQQLYYADEPGRRNYDTYRMYLQSPQGYQDAYYQDPGPFAPAADYAPQTLGLKANTNYVDFYSTTRRPSYRAEQYPGSPDSWV
ncbi:plakophilin-4-like [Anguilla rostrata]|uniref:plakophilin-4-like n=1 Tax=Anguilla rostrata TaxID=7938 RepID=UPI0030CFA377